MVFANTNIVVLDDVLYPFGDENISCPYNWPP